MAIQILNNGETGLVIRDKINDNFAEIDSPTYSPEEESSGSVISLPSTVEGGELELEVDGVTASNLVNGKGDDLTGWDTGTGRLTTSSGKFNYNANTTGLNGYYPINLKAGDKFYTRIKGKVLGGDTTGLELHFRTYLDSVQSNALDILTALDTTEKNISLVLTSTTDANQFGLRPSGTGVINAYEFYDITVINMTGTPYENFTADEMNEAFPSFFDETKSVDKMRVLSVGKNLFDGEVEVGTIDSSNGENQVFAARARTTKYIAVKNSTEYTFKLKASYLINRVYYYDNAKNYVSNLISDSNSETFTTPSDVYYVRASFINPTAGNIDNNDLENLKNESQLELGSTATAYEPYTETYSACNLPLRSVPAIADKIASNVGLHTQNVSGLIDRSDTDYDSLGTSNINVDIVRTNVPTNVLDGTVNIDGTFRVYNSSGVELEEIALSDIDLIASIGKFHYSTSEQVVLIVAKGAYVDIAAARIGLGTTQIQYQLATSITTQLIPNSFIAQPNGTVYQEAYVEDVAVYATEITIVDTDLPVLNLTHLNKIDITNGNLTQIPLSDVTIAVGGLTFTITGASAGEYYDFGYNYSSTLSLNGAVSYSYANNLKGQVDSNTKMISQNNVAINQIVSYMKMLEDRIVVLEP